MAGRRQQELARRRLASGIARGIGDRPGRGVGIDGRFIFSPLALSLAGEQGAWYDPSDLSTLYQDSAGTTPVTAMEQPVGLMLDKRFGLVRGVELVSNGAFTTDLSGWSAAGGADITVSWVAGTLQIVRGAGGIAGNPSQAITTVIGTTYEATIVGGVGSTNFNYPGGNLSVAAGATGRVMFTATSTSHGLGFWPVSVSSTCSVDSVSVKAIPGNHASQSTAAARPVLSALKNILGKTEQFDDVAWAKSGATVTANVVIAPDGFLTMDKIVESATDTNHYVRYAAIPGASYSGDFTISVFAKAAERNIINLYLDDGGGNSLTCDFDLSTLVTTQRNASGWTAPVATITDMGNGIYRCALKGNRATAASLGARFTIGKTGSAYSFGQPGYLGDGVSGLYLGGAQLEPGPTATRYQRVTTASDYDAVGFPTYLKFDGVDDFLVTGSINFTSTDKMMVAAGFKRVAAPGMIAELSAVSDSNAGSFHVYANGSQTIQFSLRGTAGVGQTVNTAAVSFNANVLSVAYDFAGAAPTTETFPRINAVADQTAPGGVDSGAGPFGNHPLYIGSRGGSGLLWNGNLYGLTIRGTASTAAQIAATERYLAAKAGVTLP